MAKNITLAEAIFNTVANLDGRTADRLDIMEEMEICGWGWDKDATVDALLELVDAGVAFLTYTPDASTVMGCRMTITLK